MNCASNLLGVISLNRSSLLVTQYSWDLALSNKPLWTRAIGYWPMLTLLALLFISPTAYSADSDSCFVVDEIIQGKECTKPNGMRINFSNRCDAPMDARYCLQMINGDWNCGVGIALKPQAKHSWWTCEGTGQYKIWGRSVNSKVSFPDPYGTYKQQGVQLYATAKGETEANACTRAQAAANNGGNCQCEPMPGVEGFQCRIAISALPASAKEPAKAFKDNEFAAPTGAPASNTPLQTVTATSAGNSADQACNAVRAQLSAADADCQCEVKGSHAVCRATVLQSSPESDLPNQLHDFGKDTLKQTTPVDPNQPPLPNGGSGKRG